MDSDKYYGYAEFKPLTDAINQAPQSTICGFWQRIWAILIDMIMLCILGAISGYFLEDFYVSLGQWGILIGLAVFLIYFGLLNGPVGKGQTLGKKLLKIRVVTKQGTAPSLAVSSLRAGIFSILFIFNGFNLTPSPISFYLVTISFIIELGFKYGFIYFYLFNRKTRQSLHDLICHTYVVKTEPSGTVNTTKIANIHYIVYASFLVLLTAGSFNIFTDICGSNSTVPYQAITKQIQTTTNTQPISLREVHYVTSNRSVRNFISTMVRTKDKSNLNPEITHKIAKIILNTFPNADKKDSIEVTVYYGYDIGIARSYKKYSDKKTPAEWMK